MDVKAYLAGGDRRSIGNANELMALLLAHPRHFAQVVEGLSSQDPLIAMRCADVAEKLSLQHPEWLAPYKKQLVKLAVRVTQKEVRWHLAQMVPRLPLSSRERVRVVDILKSYLNDESRIVVTFALQALSELANDDSRLMGEVVQLIGRAARAGSPAVRSRAKKLLGQKPKGRA